MVEAWQQAARCNRETQKLEWKMAARLPTPDGDDGLADYAGGLCEAATRMLFRVVAGGAAIAAGRRAAGQVAAAWRLRSAVQSGFGLGGGTDGRRSSEQQRECFVF